MATVLDRYVVVGSAGGDGTTTATSGANAAYASYTAAIAAIVAAFPSFVTSDVQVKLHLVSGTDTMAANPAIFTSTTDATRFLEIFFEGTYQLVQTNSFRRCMDLSTVKVVLHNLNLLHTGARTNNGSGITLTPQAGGRYEFLNGVIRCTGTGTPSAGHLAVDVVGSPATLTMIRRNLVIDGWGSTDIPSATGHVQALDNCTVVNCTTGIASVRSSGFTLLLRNNICQANGTDFAITGSGGTLTTAGNISQGLTSPDVAGQSKTIAFVNAGAGDYHLAAGETYAKTSGTDLSADATDPFNTDLEGTVRTAPWSSGPYEAVTVTDNSPAQTTANVAATHLVGSVQTVTVTARKSDGSPMTVGGAVVAATITGTNPSSPAVTDNANGTYTFTRTPMTLGADSWAITLGGVAISGSPYASNVVAGGGGGIAAGIGGGLISA